MKLTKFILFVFILLMISVKAEASKCIDMNCPERTSSLSLIKPSYNFTGNLVQGQSELYRIDFLQAPGLPSIFKYSVCNFLQGCIQSRLN